MATKTPLDADAQPIIRRFNAARLSDRAIDELIGVCRGVAADGVITTEEVGAVLKWAEQNRDAANTWPADALFARIREMLVDHTLDEQEQSELLGLLRQITGGDVPLCERVASYTSQLPLTKPMPKIEFPGRQFCMTGKFVFGSRRRCHEVVTTKGGQPQAVPTQETDYVVIGSIGNTDWIHSTHGRKIETAVKFQRRGWRVSIVSEEHWVSFLE